MECDEDYISKLPEDEKCKSAVSFTADDPYCCSEIHCGLKRGHESFHAASVKSIEKANVILVWDDK